MFFFCCAFQVWTLALTKDKDKHHSTRDCRLLFWTAICAVSAWKMTIRRFCNNFYAVLCVNLMFKCYFFVTYNSLTLCETLLTSCMLHSTHCMPRRTAVCLFWTNYRLNVFQYAIVFKQEFIKITVFTHHYWISF